MITRCASNSTRLLFFLLVLVLSRHTLAQEIAIFSVVLNAEPVGELFVVLTDDGDVWISEADLAQTRLKGVQGKQIQYEGEKYLSLKSIFGLSFAIDQEAVQLEIQAEPSLFQAQRHEVSRQKAYEVAYGAASSAYLNYALFVSETGKDSSVNITTEIGGRYAQWYGTSTFNYSNPTERTHVVRMLTSLRRDDRERLRTLVLGDHGMTTRGVLGGHLILGGVNLARNFAMDPYYSASPSFSISGALEAPAEVELYVNDALVETSRLAPGEFVLENVPAHIGQGSANVVIKDVFGNTQVISESFYYSDQLLKPGLHEYSYSLGWVREDLGSRSMSYGGPVFVGMHHYGFSENLRLGYNAEISDQVINAGPTALLVTNYGAFNLSAAASKWGDETGHGGSLGYHFRSRGLSASLTMKSVSKDFSTASISPTSTKPAFQFGSVLGWNSPALGSVSLELSSTKSHYGQDQTRYGLSYNKSLSRRVHLFANANRTLTEDAAVDYALFAGLHISLERGISADLGFSRTRDRDTAWESVQNNPRADDPLAYRFKLQQAEQGDTLTGDFSYRSHYGNYEAYVHDSGDYNASIAGGIGYIDGDTFFTRPVLDSFAKIKVGDLAGVRIYRFGRPVAVTGAEGTALLPEMQSFHDNRISIEQDDVPLDYQYSELTRYVNPGYKSGVVLVFDVHRFQAVTGRIVRRHGERAADVEYGLLQVGEGEAVLESPLSEQGEFYLEDIGAGTHLGRVYGAGQSCTVELVVPESAELLVDVGEIACDQ